GHAVRRGCDVSVGRGLLRNQAAGLAPRNPADLCAVGNPSRTRNRRSGGFGRANAARGLIDGSGAHRDVRLALSPLVWPLLPREAAGFPDARFLLAALRYR